MIEAIKLLGSIVGLLTGITYFFDRLVKGRPLASLTITQHEKRKFVCIRVSNPSQYDIAVLGVRVEPPIYFLTQSHQLREIIVSALGSEPFFFLKPSSEKELFLRNNFKANYRPISCLSM